MTDPISDMLARIRNAVAARHARVDMPASKLKAEIARILQDEGYIQGYRIVEQTVPGGRHPQHRPDPPCAACRGGRDVQHRTTGRTPRPRAAYFPVFHGRLVPDLQGE